MYEDINRVDDNYSTKEVQNKTLLQNIINSNYPNININEKNQNGNINNIISNNNDILSCNKQFQISNQNQNQLQNEKVKIDQNEIEQNKNNNIPSNDINDVQKDMNVKYNSDNIICSADNSNQNIIKNNYEEKSTNLTEKEILESKENGFILLGKTGVGKTSLLNIIFGQNVGKVGYTSKSETNKSNYYCIKEKVGLDYKYYCVVDTPGLYDTNTIEADNVQKRELMKLISEEKIKVKGLLFLSNFQNERFDASEQLSLIQYNALFPLKDFWKRIILIFTHYYGDPDGDSKEEIQQRSDKFMSEIFDVIMNKVNNVSEPVKFSEINKKYINIYSRAKIKKQFENNLNIRKDLTKDILEYSKFSPMFTRLEIYNFEKYEIEKNDKYLYDCDFYVYLDANDKVVHEDFKILKKYEKSPDLIKKQSVNVKVEGCEINNQGKLVRKSKPKEVLSKLYDKYKGEGLTVLGIIGAICTGIFCLPALPVCLLPIAGGVNLMRKKYEDPQSEENYLLNQDLNQKIMQEFNNQNK